MARLGSQLGRAVTQDNSDAILIVMQHFTTLVSTGLLLVSASALTISGFALKPDAEAHSATNQRAATGAKGKTMSGSDLSCKLTTPQMQQRRVEVLHKIRALVKKQTSLPNGYALQFAANDDCLSQLTHFIQLETKCCCFLRFKLTVEPEGGPMWLELTGPPGTKDFIKTEMELL